MNPSLPVAHTTTVDVHPDTGPSIGDLLHTLDTEALRLAAAHHRFHAALSQVVELDGCADMVTGVFDNEVDFVIAVGALARRRLANIAEARPPQAEPSWQGDEDKDAGQAPSSSPASVGSAATSPVADPTDDLMATFVAELADTPGAVVWAYYPAWEDALTDVDALRARGADAWFTWHDDSETWAVRARSRP